MLVYQVHHECARKEANRTNQQPIDVDPEVEGVFSRSQGQSRWKNADVRKCFDRAQDAQDEARPEGEMKARGARVGKP